MGEMNQLSYLGSNIKNYRKAKGLTISELAALSKTSISSISQIENGKRDPTFKVILNIAQALQIDIGKLVTSLEEVIYEHNIQIIIRFENNKCLIMGNSLSNSHDILVWGFIVDFRSEEKLCDEIFFKSNNKNDVPSTFYENQLKPYLTQQRFRILLWNALEINEPYELSKEKGINWTDFLTFVDHIQQINFDTIKKETKEEKDFKN